MRLIDLALGDLHHEAQRLGWQAHVEHGADGVEISLIPAWELPCLQGGRIMNLDELLLVWTAADESLDGALEAAGDLLFALGACPPLPACEIHA